MLGKMNLVIREPIHTKVDTRNRVCGKHGMVLGGYRKSLCDCSNGVLVNEIYKDNDSKSCILYTRPTKRRIQNKNGVINTNYNYSYSEYLQKKIGGFDTKCNTPCAEKKALVVSNPCLGGALPNGERGATSNGERIHRVKNFTTLSYNACYALGYKKNKNDACTLSKGCVTKYCCKHGS